jgi:hypothetical protein
MSIPTLKKPFTLLLMLSHLNAFVLGSVGGAKVFEGASDKQVMAYFKQLTGSKLPKTFFYIFSCAKNTPTHNHAKRFIFGKVFIYLPIFFFRNTCIRKIR